MVVEFVDARCVTPPDDRIAGARFSLGHILSDYGRLKMRDLSWLVGRRLRVTGVGFYDKIHGQSGVARNGIELHPVLALTPGR